MPFNPNHLPPTVYEAYKKGPTAWIFVIRTAIEVGYKNPDKLTDIAFYLHHPELGGETIKMNDTKLIAQWKGFRQIIKTLLSILSIPWVIQKPNQSHSNKGRSKKSNLEYRWIIEGEG